MIYQPPPEGSTVRLPAKTMVYEGTVRPWPANVDPDRSERREFERRLDPLVWVRLTSARPRSGDEPPGDSNDLGSHYREGWEIAAASSLLKVISSWRPLPTHDGYWFAWGPLDATGGAYFERLVWVTVGQVVEFGRAPYALDSDAARALRYRKADLVVPLPPDGY